MTCRLRSLLVATSVAAASLLATTGMPALADTQAHQVAGADRDVIVRSTTGGLAAARAAVAHAGGTIRTELGLIDAVAATVSDEAYASLRSRHDLVMTDDSALELHGAAGQAPTPTSGQSVIAAINANGLHGKGYTGTGIGVALVDSGVTPVAQLGRAKIVSGPDLSFEAANKGVRNLDTYGHGSHLAGLIGSTVEDASGVTEGVAPGSTIVSVKVADATGATDVSQVISALGWIIDQKSKPELNIRVVALAFGTDGVQSYTLDPLAFAVEKAWNAGLVVVVAAGNKGTSAGRLDNPAMDPFVIAVAAADTMGTATRDDDVIADYSSRGNGTRNPDVVAPGTSLVSARVPGSYIDQKFGAQAAQGEGRMRGSGTSQAAAVTAGAAALLLDVHPGLTPDQVKAALMETGRPVTGMTATASTGGMIDLQGAHRWATNPRAVTQKFRPAAGTGSLEAARGSHHVMVPSSVNDSGQANGWRVLDTEESAFGTRWTGFDWLKNTWSAGSWSGASWSGASWSGASWSAGSWSGASWSGASWSGASWSGASWSGASWSGASWSGASWSSTLWY